MTKKRPYNDKLDADNQITMEEMIASKLHEEIRGLTDPMGEEDCNALAKEILYNVLLKFRPDFFDEEKSPTPHPVTPSEAHDPAKVAKLIKSLVNVIELPIGEDARAELLKWADGFLAAIEPNKSLEELLENWQVHAPGMWDNEHGPEDWFAVSDEGSGGITAYFQHEHEALRWRLDQINRALNG